MKNEFKEQMDEVFNLEYKKLSARNDEIVKEEIVRQIFYGSNNSYNNYLNMNPNAEIVDIYMVYVNCVRYSYYYCLFYNQ